MKKTPKKTASRKTVPARNVPPLAAAISHLGDHESNGVVDEFRWAWAYVPDLVRAHIEHRDGKLGEPCKYSFIQQAYARRVEYLRRERGYLGTDMIDPLAALDPNRRTDVHVALVEPAFQLGIAFALHLKLTEGMR